MFTLILILGIAIQPFNIRALFTIFGTIRDEEGRAVSSVRVSLDDENYQPKGTVFADSSGHYQFRNLRPGSYYLRVEPTGLPFEEYSQQLDLLSLSRRASTYDEPMLVDVVLKQKKSRTAPNNTPPGVIFVQVIPPAAREQYDIGASSIKDKTSQLGIDALKRAIEIYPDYFNALELLGTEYVKLGQFQVAVPILIRAVAINNRAASSMYALGVAYLKLNSPAEAIQWLETAAAQDSGNPNIYMMLGLAYGNNLAMNQAESALKKAYQIGRARAADAHLFLAGIYDKQERYGEAWRELELYLKEAEGLKNKTQIKDMIVRLKEKEKNPPQ